MRRNKPEKLHAREIVHKLEAIRLPGRLPLGLVLLVLLHADRDRLSHQRRLTVNFQDMLIENDRLLPDRALDQINQHLLRLIRDLRDDQLQLQDDLLGLQLDLVLVGVPQTHDVGHRGVELDLTRDVVVQDDLVEDLLPPLHVNVLAEG